MDGLSGQQRFSSASFAFSRLVATTDTNGLQRTPQNAYRHAARLKTAVTAADTHSQVKQWGKREELPVEVGVEHLHLGDLVHWQLVAACRAPDRLGGGGVVDTV